MTLDNKIVGNIDNSAVHQLTLINSSGQKVVLYNFGIIIQSWQVKTKKNDIKDVILGLDDWKDYIQDHPNFGCIIGRYANRISKGQLPLGDKIYQLSKNLNGHHLHGGFSGFGKKVWQIQSAKVNPNDIEIHFFYLSPDGEEGYPGNLSTKVIVKFTEDNELIFDMYASSDQDTVCNLSQHCYFNLGNKDNILHHEMLINAFQITQTDEDLIPTGILKNVAGTPFDFTTFKILGSSITEKHPLLKNANGYDVNYVLTEGVPDLNNEPNASVFERDNQLQLDVRTSLPGLQLYTGNWLEGVRGKNDLTYKKYGGLCVEAQYFPDSPHHPNFPDVRLKAGEEYHHWIKYQLNVL